MAGDLGVISAIIGILGIVGNAIVCVVIWRNPHMHTITNGFLCNQAVADLFASLVFLLVFNIPAPDTLPVGVAGWFYCYFWKSELFMWIFLLTSANSLVLVTLERYLAIVYPFRYEMLHAWSWVPVLGIVVTWIMGIMVALSIFFLIEYSGTDNTCIFALPPPPGHKLFGMVQAINLLAFLIPAVTMLAAYIHIAVILKRDARRIQVAPVSMTQPQPTSNVATSCETALPETQGDSLLRARRNVIKTLILVFLAYSICWFPNTVVVAATITGTPFIVATVLAASNSCINPLIYTIKYKSFRQGLQLLICGKKPTGLQTLNY